MDAYLKDYKDLPTKRIIVKTQTEITSSHHGHIQAFLQDFIDAQSYQRMYSGEKDGIEIRGYRRTCLIASLSHHRPPHIKTIHLDFRTKDGKPIIADDDFCSNELKMRFQQQATAYNRHNIPIKLPCPMPQCLSKLKQDEVRFNFCLPMLGDTRHGTEIHLKSPNDVFNFMLNEFTYTHWSNLVYAQEKVAIRRPGLLLEVLFDKTRHVKTHLVTMTLYPGAQHIFCLRNFPIGYDQLRRCTQTTQNIVAKCEEGSCIYHYMKPPRKYNAKEQREREKPVVTKKVGDRDKVAYPAKKDCRFSLECDDPNCNLHNKTLKQPSEDSDELSEQEF